MTEQHLDGPRRCAWPCTPAPGAFESRMDAHFPRLEPGVDAKGRKECMEELDKVLRRINELNVKQGPSAAAAPATRSVPEEWHALIGSVVGRLPAGNCRLLLSRVAEHENIPRKRQQFLNFLRSSCHLHDNSIGERVWERLQEELHRMRDEGFHVSEQLFARKRRLAPHGRDQRQSTVPVVLARAQAAFPLSRAPHSGPKPQPPPPRD